MRRNPSGDSVTAHELALYAVNNAELYRSRIVPVIANLQRKIKRGVYDPALALKLWKYVADDAAKRYTFEYDRSGARSPWEVKGYGIFTVPIRVEAAREIAAHYSEELKSNPARRIHSAAKRAWPKDIRRYAAKRLRGRARTTSPYSGMADAVRDAPAERMYDAMPASERGSDYYHVQVKRGAAQITLASFPRGEYGKARATEYGKLLARRYPRQVFRVFWPDEKKNPLVRRRELSVPERHQLKIARDSLKMPEAMLGVMGGPTKAQAREIIARLTRKKNPAPRADTRGGAKVNAAARLYAQFTGHNVGHARRVALPAHTAGLAIGPVLGVAYETTRDGKREKYLHDFRRGARPTLAASFDGRQLYLLGGAYRFTERGIVDR